MALCHLPNPAVLASREWPSFPCASKSSGESLGWGAQQSPSCRALLLVCSAKSSRVSRKSRATKSNAELCDELREFILVVGLPEHHVPSTKELLEHGRKDLANIVRRRGHRVIAKLLRNPTNGDIAPEIGSTDRKISRKLSEEYSLYTITEDQGAQDIQYDMAGESLHEVMAALDHNGALEKNRDTLEGEDTPIYNDYEPLSGRSYVNEAEGADSPLSFPYLKEQYTVREDAVSEEILDNSDFNENTSSDLDEEGENRAEIDHLRELLRKKELELLLLKQQLEEEKIALSDMENKAHSELSKVQDIISTKDEELQAAEESLSGLKEVILEYWGNGEAVEVSGSFNGWQHKLKMEPQMPSKTVNPTGTRETILWSTALWLYPGVYEIKFIVDGHWKIDPQREFVSKDNIVNNILRVDRDDDEPGHRHTP